MSNSHYDCDCGWLIYEKKKATEISLIWLFLLDKISKARLRFLRRMAKALPLERQAEDCLHLNIFVPIEQGRHQTNAIKIDPVPLAILVKDMFL